MFTFKIEGLEDVDKVLTEIAPSKARNLIRSTVHGYIARITKLAKQTVKKQTGTLKKAIKTKRLKSSPDKPNSAVFVTHGKSVKNDAWYWRFVEYGTSGKTAQEARPFIRVSAQKIQTNKIEIMREEFSLKLQKVIAKELKKRRKN